MCLLLKGEQGNIIILRVFIKDFFGTTSRNEAQCISYLQKVFIEIRDVENSSGQPFQHDLHFYVTPVISQKWAELLAEQSKLLWKYKADTWLLM